MPDITVHRHGDRWAVAERGAESPRKEFDTREAAELAARDLAAGGTIEVLDEDPTSLQHESPEDAGERQTTGPEGVDPSDAATPPRAPQAGL